ncbi:hypothetical protein Tco_0261229 [Tanacetum coccineum]
MASSSGESVMSNDDLLIQILVRLPALSLVLFKSVSKHRSSLIKDDDNLTFRSNLDPPSGIFLEKVVTLPFSVNEGSFNCDFVPLDIRIPTNITFGPDLGGDFKILHSYNGLLLCRTYSENILPVICLRLFESRGCLLLVDKGADHSRHLTIYEKGNVYSEWSLSDSWKVHFEALEKQYNTTCVKKKHKEIWREVEVQVPKPPSRTPENVIEDVDVVEQATNTS